MLVAAVAAGSEAVAEVAAVVWAEIASPGEDTLGVVAAFQVAAVVVDGLEAVGPAAEVDGLEPVRGTELPDSDADTDSDEWHFRSPDERDGVRAKDDGVVMVARSLFVVAAAAVELGPAAEPVAGPVVAAGPVAEPAAVVEPRPSAVAAVCAVAVGAVRLAETTWAWRFRSFASVRDPVEVVDGLVGPQRCKAVGSLAAGPGGFGAVVAFARKGAADVDEPEKGEDEDDYWSV